MVTFNTHSTDASRGVSDGFVIFLIADISLTILGTHLTPQVVCFVVLLSVDTSSTLPQLGLVFYKIHLIHSN